MPAFKRLPEEPGRAFVTRSLAHLVVWVAAHGPTDAVVAVATLLAVARGYEAVAAIGMVVLGSRHRGE